MTSPGPAAVLDLLDAQPRRLEVVTAGVPAEVLSAPPADGEWSALEVLAHLHACADVWGEAVRRMLTEDRPVFRAVSPRSQIMGTDAQSFGPSLHAFLRQRRALLADLQDLPPQAWSRTATVTGAGRPLERTVLAYATRLATHERPHVAQVERAVRDGRQRPGSRLAAPVQADTGR